MDAVGSEMLGLEPACGQEHAGNAAALRDRCPKMPIMCGTWDLRSTSVFPAGAVNSKEGNGVSPLWGQICCEHFRNSIGRNWRVESEEWKGQYQTSKCHFLSFLASVEDWSLFLFQCFLLYLYHSSYFNSTAQGRVQRRWRCAVEGGAAVGRSLYKGKSGEVW